MILINSNPDLINLVCIHGIAFLHQDLLTTLSAVALNSLCIFMASTTIRVWPAVTSFATFTGIFTTLPGIGERIVVLARCVESLGAAVDIFRFGIDDLRIEGTGKGVHDVFLAAVARFDQFDIVDFPLYRIE